MFGFQYKALYKNGIDHWPLTQPQFDALRNHWWIYYCLSELRLIRDQRASLHLSRIVSPSSIQYQARISARGENKIAWYWRWGAFYEALKKCTTGIQIRSSSALDQILNLDHDEQVSLELRALGIHMFLTDLVKGRAIHYSPRLERER